MKPALLLFTFFTFITGFIYPLFITGISDLIFPIQSHGSLVNYKGQPIGSLQIGQLFTSDGYFWGRPSATDYSALPSNASNLSPTNKKFRDIVDARVKTLKEKNGGVTPPSDLVYASGSGLDPHISIESALYQVDRIAKARNLSPTEIRQLKEFITIQSNHTWRLTHGSHINVLEMNLTLEQQFPKK